MEYDIFTDYKQAFSQSTEIKNRKKSKGYKEKTPTEQSAELEHRFIAYLHKIEKEKLYYFILAHEQGGNVLIVKAPDKTSEQKRFLGYGWSTRRNEEGIKYEGGAKTVNDIITPLFDPKGLDNDNKINMAIKRNFIGETIELLPEHCHYSKLTDMLNFSLIDFNKRISLNPKQHIDIESKWEQKSIENLLINIDGKKTQIQESEIAEEGETAVITQEKDLLISGYTNKKEAITDLPLIVFGDHSCTFKYIDFPFIRGADGTQLLKVDENELLPKCFYYLVHLVEIPNKNKYERHLKYLEKLKIPLPPLEIQQQIIDECEKVDQETNEAQQTVTEARQQIEKIVNQLWNENEKVRLDNVIRINTTTYNPTLKPDQEFIYINIDSVGKANGVIDFSQRLTGKSAPSRARRIAKNGNTIISTVRPHLKGFAFVDTDGIDDCVFSTGFAILESKDPESLLNKVIYCFFMYMNELMQQMINTMDKSSYPSINEDDIKYYQIPVPPINIQQQLVAKVECLEADIAEAQSVIDNASERKNAILRKYL